MASSFLRLVDPIKRRTTVGRSDQLTQRSLPDNIQNRQISVPPVGFKPAVSADERSQTYALDHAATGIGFWSMCHQYFISGLLLVHCVRVNIP